jgi:hypothetical protein
MYVAKLIIAEEDFIYDSTLDLDKKRFNKISSTGKTKFSPFLITEIEEKDLNKRLVLMVKKSPFTKTKPPTITFQLIKKFDGDCKI